MALSPETRQQIEGLLEQHRVVLFMKGNKHFPQCGFSARVIKVLKEVGADFFTVNVLSDASIREGIKEFSDWPTIPQLYVNKEFLGGCDIVTEMHAAGELETVLGVEKKPVVVPTLHVTPAAAAAFEAASEGDDVLRIGISDEFEHELFFAPAEAGDLVVEAHGLRLHLDKGSASRAEGLRIDFVEGPGGGGFRLENPNEPPRVKSMQVEELDALIKSGEPFVLVDVRTEQEIATASIAQAKPLEQVEAALRAGAKDQRIVFQCHHGMRSRAAAERFVRDGFRNVYNLEGGIDAWSTRVDDKVARY